LGLLSHIISTYKKFKENIKANIKLPRDLNHSIKKIWKIINLENSAFRLYSGKGTIFKQINTPKRGTSGPDHKNIHILYHCQKNPAIIVNFRFFNNSKKYTYHTLKLI
jgi:hypothetical protein